MNEEYLDAFMEEATEQLACLEKNISKSKEAQDSDTFMTIRRCAHTLKGSSAIMELSELSELCKMVEFTGRDLAEGKLQYDESTQTLLDKVIPVLKEELENVKSTKSDGLQSTKDLKTQLQDKL